MYEISRPSQNVWTIIDERENLLFIIIIIIIIIIRGGLGLCLVLLSTQSTGLLTKCLLGMLCEVVVKWMYKAGNIVKWHGWKFSAS